jgi:hypothetical protein
MFDIAAAKAGDGFPDFRRSPLAGAQSATCVLEGSQRAERGAPRWAKWVARCH